MPLSELHKVKRNKNIAVVILLILFMLVIYGITVVRISQGLAP